MVYRNRRLCVHFIIGALLALVFVVMPGRVMAESAGDYIPLFDIKGQFNPSILVASSDGQYQLAYPANTPPHLSPPGRFRVFIPPGAVKISLKIYAAQSAQVGIAARYNVPPQCDYSQVSGAYWRCYPWDIEGTGSLAGLTSRDMRFKSTGGVATAIYQYFSSPFTQGGWMFIRLLGPGLVFHFQYNVWVDPDAYSAWYATGTVPEVSGTVSGSCTFAPDPDCSPTSGTSSPNNNNTSTNPIEAIFGNIQNNGGGVENPLDWMSTFFGGTSNSGTGGNKNRLDVEIDTTVNGLGSERVFTDSDLKEYGIIALNPSLKLDALPSEEVECFAMIVANQAAGFIYRETIFDGPSWLFYSGSDRIYRYRIDNIAEKTTWVCTAFDFLKHYSLPPSFFTENRLQFLYAIAPVGEVAMGKFENLRFGLISFRPDEEAASETESSVTDETLAD